VEGDVERTGEVNSAWYTKEEQLGAGNGKEWQWFRLWPRNRYLCLRWRACAFSMMLETEAGIPKLMIPDICKLVLCTSSWICPVGSAGLRLAPCILLCWALLYLWPWGGQFRDLWGDPDGSALRSQVCPDVVLVQLPNCSLKGNRKAPVPAEIHRIIEW